MSITNDILRAKERLDASNAPESKRYIRLYPGMAYTLCAELQASLEITSPAYENLNNCRAALARKNWSVAKAAMPQTLYGIRLILIA